MQKLTPAHRKIIFHPVLVAVYPILSLYINNMQWVKWTETLLVFALTLFTLAVIWFLVNRIVREKEKGAFIVSIFFLFVFFYGNFIDLISRHGNQFLGGVFPEISTQITSPRSMTVILIVWLLLFAFITLLVTKTKIQFHSFTSFMHVFSIALMLLSIVSAVQSTLRSQSNLRKFTEMAPEPASSQEIGLTLPDKGEWPNIYYIILDGYARTDVMRDLYAYDNSEWINSLQQHHFFVASQANSNYYSTFLSLTSSLNLGYLSDFVKQSASKDSNIPILWELCEDNQIMNLLRGIGYSIVYLPASGNFLPNLPSDVRLVPPSALGSFEVLAMNATPLRLILHGWTYDHQRNWIRYQLETLPEVSQGKNLPTFVIAHLLLPHPPFVFKADGAPINPPWEFVYNDGDKFTRWYGKDVYVENYREQAIYASAQAKQLVESLIKNDPSAIVVIQSDHGPGSTFDGNNLETTNLDERFSILNAYYFPDFDYASLYEDITPVNTFRVVLNQYFGADFDLLPDLSFWTPDGDPQDQIDITDRLYQP